MTASLSRFAYSSPVQAGERQTVRHVIGARRPQNEDSLKLLGAQPAGHAPQGRPQLRVLSLKASPSPPSRTGLLECSRARSSAPPLELAGIDRIDRSKAVPSAPPFSLPFPDATHAAQTVQQFGDHDIA